MVSLCGCLPRCWPLAPPVGERRCGRRPVRPSHRRRSCSLCPSSHSRRPQKLGGGHRLHARLAFVQEPRSLCFGWKTPPLTSFGSFFFFQKLNPSFSFPGFVSSDSIFLFVCLFDFYGLSKMDSGYLSTASPSTCEF